MVSNADAAYACTNTYVRLSSFYSMSYIYIHFHSVYELRPKPYGVELTSWCYDDETDSFSELKVESN